MSSVLSSSKPSAAEATDAPQPRRRHRRQWLWALAIVGAVIVALTGVIAARYAFREHPGPKAVESAVQRFRTLPANPPVTGVRYPSPPAGVYELQGRGSEHISFPPNSQQDGSVMPATVTHEPDGCWLWRVDYNVAHSEEYQFCPRAVQLVLGGSGNTQTWDFGLAKVKNVAQFTCEPPATVLSADPRPGETYVRVCTGTSTAMQGQTTTTTTTRIVGTGDIVIGGVKRVAVHQVQQTSITGVQTGSETAEWWQAATTGLPLRMERHIKLESSSPLGGTITYTEDGSWQMATLQPRT